MVEKAQEMCIPGSREGGGRLFCPLLRNLTQKILTNRCRTKHPDYPRQEKKTICALQTVALVPVTGSR